MGLGGSPTIVGHCTVEWVIYLLTDEAYSKSYTTNGGSSETQPNRVHWWQHPLPCSIFHISERSLQRS